MPILFHFRSLHTTSSEQRLTTAGFALLDVMIAITIFLLMTPVLVVYLNLSTSAVLQKAAATQMLVVANSSKRYIDANASTLKLNTTTTEAFEVDWTALQTGGFLSSAMKNKNVYGQSYRIWVLQNAAGFLEGYILTYGGSATQNNDEEFVLRQIPATAALIGASGGYMDSRIAATGVVSPSSSIATGAFGGWQVDLSSTSITLPNTADSSLWNAGHLVAITAYTEDFTDDEEFLHRLPASDTAMNAMATDLSLTVSGIAHNIDGVDTLTASGDITGSQLIDADNASYAVDPSSRSDLQSVYTSYVYDSDNTSYYLNPNSSSNINTLYSNYEYTRKIFDRDDNTYYIDPSSMSNFYRIQTDYYPTADDDVATKEYVDDNIGTLSIDLTSCISYTWTNTKAQTNNTRYCPTGYVVAGMKAHSSDSAEWDSFFCCPFE
jgi:hypothetical protein